jgi:hypothetical protein
MVTSLQDNFKDDTTTNANTVSNAWNYMFMTVGYIYTTVLSKMGYRGNANTCTTTIFEMSLCSVHQVKVIMPSTIINKSGFVE